MLERKKKPGIKKTESSEDFTKDTEIYALFNVLKMADSKEEEWNEFYYLLNARYFLKEVIEKRERERENASEKV